MIDKTKIAEQAKKIMDEFVALLNKAEKAEVDFKVKRKLNIRQVSKEDLSNKNLNPDFRDRMFDNAPLVKDGYILAEKKKW